MTLQAQHPRDREISEDEASSGSSGRSWLIDVRTPTEFQSMGNAIPGALNIEYQNVASAMPSLITARASDGIVNAEPDKEAHVYLYCRSGRRSAIAKAELEVLGFMAVRDLGSAEEAREVLEGEGLLGRDGIWGGGGGGGGNVGRDSGSQVREARNVVQRSDEGGRERLEKAFLGLVEGLRQCE